MSAFALITGPSSLFNPALARQEASPRAEPPTVALLLRSSVAGEALRRASQALCDVLLPGARLLGWDGNAKVLPEGLRRADELWLCRPVYPFEKILASAAPDCPIMLFDEGIGSFAPYPIGEPLGPRPALATLQRLEMPADLVTRTRAALFTFDGWCTPPHLSSVARINVPRPEVLAQMELLGRAFQWGLPREVDALVTGTAFHLHAHVAIERKARHYARLTTKLLEEGRRVTWTEHPRASRPLWQRPEFADTLRDPAFNVWQSPLRSMTEILALSASPKLTISLGSTVQPNLGEWFGVSAMISADTNLEVLPDLFPPVRLMRERFEQMLVE